jgi:hypothetical protein
MAGDDSRLWSRELPAHGPRNLPESHEEKQVIFQSVPARLIAERSKRVRYDIDGGDMLAYWLHSGSFPSRSLIDAAMLNNL